MLTYDPVAQLRHYPISMRRFGLNPYGEPLYRIVFAPSRRYLVVGEWPDGSNCAQWTPLYRQLGNIWVMEKWRSGEEFAKCTKEQWNESRLILGPFPDRGDYELCHSFEVVPPDDCSIEKLITMLECRATDQENALWHRKDAEKQTKDTRTIAEDMIRNKLPAFGGRVLASSRIQRGTKTAPLLLTAQQAGLPTRPGLRTKPNRPQQAA